MVITIRKELSMHFKNIFSAGKIKALSAAAVVLCCIFTLSLAVSAAAGNKIELKANGSEALLILDFPQAAAEEIASVQISLSVRTDSDGARIEFVPDSELAAKITESRYHSDTGILNIYLAGTEALFSASKPLSAGKVTISGGSASAVVEVVEDSVRFVRGGEVVKAEGEIDYPAPVSISASGNPDISLPNTGDSGFGVPSVTSASEETSVQPPPAETASSDSSVSSVTDAPVQITSSDNRNTAPPESSAPPEPSAPPESSATSESNESFPPTKETADVSALSEALSIADGLDKGRYTKSSLAAVTEAADRARALLFDPSVTRADIDEALLELENAIGMLEISGAPLENNDGEISEWEVIPDSIITEITVGEETADTGASGVTETVPDGGTAEPADNGGSEEALPQGDSSEAQPTENEENDGGHTVLIIILIAAAAVIAALAALAAVGAARRKKKK